MPSNECVVSVSDTNSSSGMIADSFESAVDYDVDDHKNLHYRPNDGTLAFVHRG
ncbi:MAG: hypothetical protein MN733_31465 [Nitrososphaera sp.]|nr:hypothetical protein [Nitrososphaera sp.]